MLNSKPEEHNFQVMIRVRPPQRNHLGEIENSDDIKISEDLKTIEIVEGLVPRPHSFTFDRVFAETSSQNEVFQLTGRKAVENALLGYNSTILAYGQTGTGKTFTVEGGRVSKGFLPEQQQGLIPRSVSHIFEYIKSQSIEKVIVRVSYLQIYNEGISDLLRPERVALSIRESKEKGVFVENLSEFIIRDSNDALRLLRKGALQRVTASTKQNDISSRSHSVFVVTVERLQSIIQEGREVKQGIVGTLNLVDLAGSERLKITQAKGQRLEESKKINQSLSCLGKVIAFLADKNQSKGHIPYRESKLTRLLEKSLGGNCITFFLAMISPGVRNLSETLQTLKFAKNAKKIKNKPRINQNFDQQSLLVKYEVELKKLKLELAQKNKQMIDHAKVLELEEKHQRAQKDKQEALKQLEMRTQAFIKEREEKKMLKQKIEYLEKYVLDNSLDSPKQKNDVFDYQTQKNEFEQEKQMIEKNNVQSEQYQQLLLQQREIMQALTQRLKERDENIAELQQELEAQDQIQNETEELLEIKNQRVQLLEKLLRENNIEIPEVQNFNSNENSEENRDDQEFEIFEKMVNNSLSKQNSIKNLKAKKEEQTKILKEEFQNKINFLNNQHLSQQKLIQEKLKKSEQHNKELIEILEKKFQGQYMNSQIDKTISIMKKKINNIIQELSKDSNPDNLKIVAEDLLTLHNFIEKLDKKHQVPISENPQNQLTPPNAHNFPKEDIKKTQKRLRSKNKSKISQKIPKEFKGGSNLQNQINRTKNSDQKKSKNIRKKGYQPSELLNFFPSKQIQIFPFNHLEQFQLKFIKFKLRDQKLQY